jgi:hypothetical protein
VEQAGRHRPRLCLEQLGGVVLYPGNFDPAVSLYNLATSAAERLLSCRARPLWRAPTAAALDISLVPDFTRHKWKLQHFLLIFFCASLVFFLECLTIILYVDFLLF